MKQKLVILLGPSGSGKSTIARRLAASEPTFCVLEQDYFKLEILKNSQTPRSDAAALMNLNIKALLDLGHSVITDGLYNVAENRTMLDKLFDEINAEPHIFNFNISLGETQRRHTAREKSKTFSGEQLAEWYVDPAPLGYDFETMVDESLSEDQVLELVVKNLKRSSLTL